MMEDDISDTELVSAAEKAEADANDDTINEAVSDIELCEALDEYERSVKAVPSTMTEFDDISDSELVAAAETNAEIDENASDAELYVKRTMNTCNQHKTELKVRIFFLLIVKYLSIRQTVG